MVKNDAPLLSPAILPDLALSIRSATEGDVAAIAAIYGHHVLHGTATFETEPPSVEEMQRRRAVLLEQGYPYLAAECDGTVIGYAYASTYRPRTAYRHTAENSIYLRPDMVGRGVGSRLLAALVEACTARGFRQMIAVVGDSTNLPSVRMHERQDFRLIGTLRGVGYKHGRWLDTVLLQRSLGPGSDAPPQPRSA